ncbi:MAG: protease inhibitor I42 family protein [Lentisphaeria bacterium]|nr:protease inhibitor I42 family protein [Lentisphaeria bacterium]
MTILRLTICLFWTILVACLMTACRSPQNILLTESDSGRTLDLCVGDTIVVALGTNRTAGFDWYPRHGAGDVQILAEKGDRYVYDPDPVDVRKPAAGQEGSHYFAYRVIGPGICGIALDYKRSWEKKDPAKVFEVMVRATGTPEEAASDPREMPPEEGPVYMTDSKGNVTIRPDTP